MKKYMGVYIIISTVAYIALLCSARFKFFGFHVESLYSLFQLCVFERIALILSVGITFMVGKIMGLLRINEVIKWIILFVLSVFLLYFGIKIIDELLDTVVIPAVIKCLLIVIDIISAYPTVIVGVLFLKTE